MSEPNGLYYMRARYYDPSIGRFISEDPSGFDGGDVNLYAYCNNNPINFIDINGEYPVWIIATAAVLLVAYTIEAIFGYPFGHYPPSGLRGGSTATDLMYTVEQHNRELQDNKYAGGPPKK